MSKLYLNTGYQTGCAAEYVARKISIISALKCVLIGLAGIWKEYVNNE